MNQYNLITHRGFTIYFVCVIFRVEFRDNVGNIPVFIAQCIGGKTNTNTIKQIVLGICGLFNLINLILQVVRCGYMSYCIYYVKVKWFIS